MKTQRSVTQTTEQKQASKPSSARVSPLKLAEKYLQAFLGWFFHIFLSTFNELQDALLAITALRKLIVFALAPKCQPTVASHISDGASLVSFEDLEYHVSDEARELLLHAGMHALITPKSFYKKEIPSIGRILLQYDADSGGKFPEAVAGALAHSLKASLLIVDDTLLSNISLDLLGKTFSTGESLDSSVWAYALSFWLSGGIVAFVWDVLQQICATRSGKPLIVLIKDADKTICDSYESCDAFTDAFGKLDMNPLKLRKNPRSSASRVILIATASLQEEKAKPNNGLRSTLEKMTTDRKGSSGVDDLASLLFPDLALMAQDDKINAKRKLEKLFMTKVELKLQVGSPAADKHKKKVEEDAADLRESQNKSELILLGVGRSSLDGLSRLLRSDRLSHQDWVKVVTWARSMEAIIQTKAAIEAQHEFGASDAEILAQISEDVPAHPKSMRRSMSSLASTGVSLEDFRSLAKLGSLSMQNKKDSSPKALLSDGFDLSERALAYGLRMLKASNGKASNSVKTENAYEKNLLKEVISPEDAGNGFAEVGALGPVKDVLREVVQFPLQYPDLFQAGSLATHSKGVLLFGPPGTGKTLLARAVASECGASFLAIHPSAVASKWLGDGVRYIKAAFSLAQKMAPCVIFLDEVDALLSRRNSHHEHEALREMKNEAMAQWDGIRQSSGPSDRVIVLGATNRPQDLDEAVLRRFSRRVFCDLPDRKAREAILKVILRKERLAENVDLSKIANRTDGYTGSDLRQVCTNAALRPVKELLRTTGKEALAQQNSKEEKFGNGAQNLSNERKRNGDDEWEEERTGKRQQNGKQESNGHQKTSVSGHHIDSHGRNEETLGSQGSDLDLAEDQILENTDLAEKSGLRDIEEEGDKRGEERRGTGTSNPGKEETKPAPSPNRKLEMQRMEIMDRLLEDCDRMALRAQRLRHVELRSITAEDFEEAIKQTAPSTDKDSYGMDELRTWNSTYGEGKDKSYRNPRLSYFI